MATWFRRITLALALAYPVALLVVLLLLRFVGQAWWVTAVGLFLPRLGFALPLLLLVPAVLLLRAWRVLWAEVGALLLVLFPLMGLTLPTIMRDRTGPVVRVLSFNVDSEYSGVEVVSRAILATSPDVVLLQESVPWSHITDELRASFGTVEESDQFVLATRYRLLGKVEPPRVVYQGRPHSPRVIKYVVASPLGALTIYSFHPHSPRLSFYRLRGQGLRHEITSGRLFRGLAAPDIEDSAGLRALQMRALDDLARRESGPTLIVGDTNEPELGPEYESSLGHYRDAFRQAGSGFGYTFPAQRPWMRIDRILLNEQLGATRFEVGCQGASDHLCVVADVVGAR